jgi:hypothetical protein
MIKDLKDFDLYPAFIGLYQRPTRLKPWLFCSWLLENPQKKAAERLPFE